jgi:hypothetical protein
VDGAQLRAPQVVHDAERQVLMVTGLQHALAGVLSLAWSVAGDGDHGAGGGGGVAAA